MFFHGGGWVIGDLETHDQPCRQTCRDAGVSVLSVDYRLAPEHKAPAAAQDCLAAYLWAVEHAGDLGVAPDRIAVGGDSAGGNLAAVVAQQARDTGAQLPLLQFLIYPAVDFTVRRPSRDLFAEGSFSPRRPWTDSKVTILTGPTSIRRTPSVTDFGRGPGGVAAGAYHDGGL